MLYVAIVKDRYQENAQWEVIKRDYNSKKNFKTDLYGNGYIIKNSYIFTEEEWNDDKKMEEICERLQLKKDRKKIRSQAKRDVKKYMIEKYGEY